jgi:hypothetical protein
VKTKIYIAQLKQLLCVGIVLSAVVLSAFPSQKVHAAGSGAGKQSAAPTTSALTAVNSATTVAQVSTAVQSFLNQYSVTLSTAAFSGDNWSGSALDAGNFASIKQFSTGFIEEWAKYTPTWVTASHLQTIYFTKNLTFTPGSSFHYCANFGNTLNFLVFDMECVSGPLDERYAIHHEYAHYLIYEQVNSYSFNTAAWDSNNPAGFHYGNGGASTYGDTGFINNEHPQNGFVSNYSTSGREEDQAEVYRYLFKTDEYTKLQSWISGGDTQLVQKVSLMKAFIASIDPSMNDAYFTAIHAYAVDNNTQTTPFSGPGQQYYNPDSGNLVWLIPSGTTTTSGIGIGTDPIHKQTLIVDGSISGGSFSGVTVGGLGGGGVLMGTGTIQLFVDIQAGGVLAPGHSPGCLNSGDLSIAGTYQAEIGGAIACSEYDQMKVTGTVDVTGGTLTSSLYNNYVPKAGEIYIIIDNDGTDAVTGTFAGLAEGATFTLGSTVLKISYKGGTGNDVVLSVVSAPAVPNTGLALVKNNPLLVLGATLLSTMALFYIAHRTRRNLRV